MAAATAEVILRGAVTVSAVSEGQGFPLWTVQGSASWLDGGWVA